MMGSFSFQVIANGFVAVESFFLMSGLLTSYTMMIVHKKNVSLSVPQFIFLRFWRELPPYLIFYCMIPLILIMGEGPFWNEISRRFKADCEKDWWQIPLLISNLMPEPSLCFPHTWYTAADLQLSILSLLILIPLLSLLTRYSQLVYVRPYTHLSPYCVGMALGYVLSRTKKTSLSWRLQFCGWIGATLLSLGSIYTTYIWHSGLAEPIGGFAAFYSGTHRTTWAVALSWVIFACHSGHGGIVNTILTWKALIPLSRLTYVAYFVHPILQLYIVASLRQPIVVSESTLAFFFIAYLVLTFMVSYGASLICEAPFIALRNIICRTNRQKIVEKTSSLGNDTHEKQAYDAKIDVNTKF